MRYDTPVYIRQAVRGAYDASTGDYGDDTVTETEVYASVMSTGADTLRLVYGELREGSLTIQFQNRQEASFDRVRVGDTVYAVDFVRNLRTKQTLIVSEVK